MQFLEHFCLRNDLHSIFSLSAKKETIENLVSYFLLASLTDDDSVYGLDNQCGTDSHQSVVHRTRVVGLGDGYAALQDDVARVDLMAEEEGRDARFLVAMDDGPVDRRRAAILRQQGGVQIERTQAWHFPNNARQHAEGDDDLQIGAECAQFVDEGGVREAFGLQHA